MSPARTLCEAFGDTVAAYPDRIAVRSVGRTGVTWADYAQEVARIAGGLAGLGVERGHSVALMMDNRPEFHFCDTAVMHLGAVPVSVYNTAPAGQIAHLLRDADVHTVICTAQYLDPVRAAMPDTPVKNLVCIDLQAGAEAADAHALADLDGGGFDLAAAARSVGPDDLVTLIYTSSTTGAPKGVEITHRNILAQFAGTSALVPMDPGDRVLSYLPSAHIADRFSAHYQAIIIGLQTTCVPTLAGLGEAMREVRPTFFMAVPRVWEKLKSGLRAAGSPPARQARAAIGLDQVKWVVSGAAPISLDVLEFFGSIDLPILEVWGMSETTCVATMNRPGRSRFATVGHPIDGVEVRLADDGELLCRGPIVMRGYRNQPQLTAEIIDQDGWVHTGDIATIDNDGYVSIVDRKKDLIINSAGKNMSPTAIEAHLKAASPLIGTAVAVGDRRPYNVALLTLEPDALAAYCTAHGVSADDPAVPAEIERGVQAANQLLARVEQIKKYTVLDQAWQPSGDELTPTSKLKRKAIAEKYAREIDALYE